METGVHISNGIGWSPDGETMYYTDSPRQVIYAYDFEPGSGAISNRRVFVRTPESEGVPDGLAVDSEGCVWSARWDGWRVTRYDPEGQVEREIRLPVARPTSCAFGGENLDELFVTSAWIDVDEQARREQPHAGDLFRIRTGVRGQAEPLFLG
jgi:sugar lactone lactonase YvrE